ncbi:CD209 antigen-like protein E [Xyrichtys novacula]|uniref:CD209 antigen-like protein E n=1 Tax=Xyrichtys novacula TaxID=13765 RepID=A0AAV1FEF2_XYRNO|nr:CD209 antigen-like protein E [Xyrichtys novacula]
MESTGTNDDIYDDIEMEGVDKNNAVSSTDREYYNNQREELQRNYEAKLGNLSDELQTTHLIREAKVRELTQQVRELTQLVRDIVTMIAKGRNCDTGWKKYGLSCYFVSTAKKNWAASREDCKAQGADLVVINSEEEKDFVTGLRSASDEWIGLTDSAQEGSWMWVDGTPVTTTSEVSAREETIFTFTVTAAHKQETGEYNYVLTKFDLNKIKDAVSSTDQEYCNNQRAELQRNYEAKLENLSHELKTTYHNLTAQVRDIMIMIAKGRNCDTGWKKYGHSCYFVSTARKSWAASREDCKAQEADLVVMNNEEEKDFVSGLVSGGENTWIGLTDSAQEGTWMWLDGTPVTTTYWESGQPNSSGGDQDCGEMVQRGEWNDETCSTNNIWICEKKLAF